MNLIPVVAASGGRQYQPEAITNASDDASVTANAQASLDAATAAKDAAEEELEAACAQAARESFYAGSRAELVATIDGLVKTITRLEGEIEFHTRAIAGLA